MDTLEAKVEALAVAVLILMITITMDTNMDTSIIDMVRKLVTLLLTTGLVTVKLRVIPPLSLKERVLLPLVLVLMEVLKLLLMVLMDLVPRPNIEIEFIPPVTTGPTIMMDMEMNKAPVTIGPQNKKMTMRPKLVLMVKERLQPFLITKKVLDLVGVKKRLMLSLISTKNMMKKEITGLV